jgi:uncharacterized membrane protein
MLPEPLHPAIVHLPMALAALAPAGVLLAMLALWSGSLPIRAWVAVVLVQLALAGTSLLAVETGEGDEERVEAVVPGNAIETHEERAERFVVAVLAAAAISLGGLLRGRWGETARIATLGASAIVLVLGIQVGHSGGELVYRHGAASAYTTRTAPGNEVGGAGVSLPPQHESGDD